MRSNQWIAAICAAALCGFAFGVAAQADEKPEMSAEEKAMMEAWAKMSEVRAEHKQLEYFVGKWNEKISMWMEPGKPAQESVGTATQTSMFGGRFVEMKHEGTWQGQPHIGHGLTGFDNLRGEFVSQWIDNMSTGIWLSYGSYDAATKTYTFKGEMDDFMKAGAKVPVRDVVRIVDDKNYVFEWYETRDGKEAKTMQIEYTRM